MRRGPGRADQHEPGPSPGAAPGGASAAAGVDPGPGRAVAGGGVAAGGRGVDGRQTGEFLRQVRGHRLYALFHVVAVWTPAQLAEFLSSVAGHPMFAVYHLIAMRGLRRGEACGLTWDDLDLDDGIAYISRQLQQGAGGRLKACPSQPETSASSKASRI